MAAILSAMCEPLDPWTKGTSKGLGVDDGKVLKNPLCFEKNRIFGCCQVGIFWFFFEWYGANVVPFYIKL